jgi:RNA polymerase sigma factor (sigma-70 family)
LPDTKSRHKSQLSDLSDINLVNRVQLLRDQAAFKELVLRHSAKVRGFLTRLCQDKDQADDLAQECFLLAFRHIGKYQPSGQFSSWLLKIAQRCYLQEKRLTSRRTEKWQQFQSQESDNRHSDHQADVKWDLEKAFTMLSESETICLTLCYTMGYSHAEVADISGFPLGSVKTYIRTGKDKLRELLEPQLTENNNV